MKTDKSIFNLDNGISIKLILPYDKYDLLCYDEAKTTLVDMELLHRSTKKREDVF